MNWLVSHMSWLPGSVINQDAYQTQVKQVKHCGWLEEALAYLTIVKADIVKLTALADAKAVSSSLLYRGV